MPQSPAEQNARCRDPQQAWGLGAAAEEPRFTPGTSGARARPTPSSLAGGHGAMPRERRRCRRAGGAFGGTVTPANAPRSSATAGTEAQKLSGGALACDPVPSPPRGAPAAMLKTSSLPARFCSPAALILPTPAAAAAGRPGAKPDPSYGPGGVTTDPQNCSPQPGGAQGRGCPPDPGLLNSSGRQRQSPGHRPPSGHAPAAVLRGAGRKIKISLAKQAPVLSALFFSSKDTKEFKHGA